MMRLFLNRMMLILLALATWACAVGGFLVWNGVILLNQPDPAVYPVRGVDVSSWQGEIDWNVLAQEDIHFAYIKATEGSTFVDQQFAYNYASAIATDLRVGAYHFFSYDSSGKKQVEHFIETVPVTENMLPPVIDLEFYGDYAQNPPDRTKVRRELNAFIEGIEEHYGMRPVIYATEKSYELYLSGGYPHYDIWIRGVYSQPTLSDGKNWTFWQYTNRARLDGYHGRERFIDMNLFRGTLEEFKNYHTKLD